jgi:hypothetical protein
LLAHLVPPSMLLAHTMREASPSAQCFLTVAGNPFVQCYSSDMVFNCIF